MKNNDKKENFSFKKLKTAIISIIVSIVAWIGIVNTVNPDVTETFYDIKIQVNGTAALRDKGLVMVDSSKLPACSVKVRGKRKDIIEAMNKTYAVINVADINRQGKSTVAVVVNSPSAVNLEKQKLSTVEINVEPCYEKEIPVKVRQEGVAKDKIIESSPENEMLTIYGSRSDLDKVYGCSVMVDLSAVTADNSTLYPFTYTAEDHNDIAKPDTIYCAAANILVLNTVYTKKAAAFKLSIDKEIQALYRIEYNEKDFADKSVEVGVKEGETAPSEVEYILERSRIRIGENDITLEAEKIDNVYIPRREIEVKMNIEELVKKQTSVTVTPLNVSEGLMVNMPSVVLFMLTGTEKELSDVRATIELSGLNAGTYSIPAKFENDKIKFEEPCLVTVTLAGKEG